MGARIWDGAMVLLAVGVLIVIFVVIYKAGHTDEPGPPIVDVRS